MLFSTNSIEHNARSSVTCLNV